MIGVHLDFQIIPYAIAAPSDQDLMSIMMARLTQLEQRLHNANMELAEKVGEQQLLTID